MAVENRGQFEAWLKEQSPEVCTAIAVRAALRVVPLVCSVQTDSEPQKKLALMTFRTVLASGAAAVGPTPDVRAAAGAAARAAARAADAVTDAAADAAARAADAAARAADAATDAGARAAARAAARATDAAADAATYAAYTSTDVATYAAGAAARAAYAAAAAAARAARAAAGAATYADTTLPAEPHRMLETGVQGLQAIIEAAERLSRQDGRIWVLTAGGDWSFWSRWYERAMAGNPLPWDLQREVALIPNEIWEQGPEAVAERIAEIEADYLARATQLAEEVTLNPETGTFSVTPRPLENAPLLSALLSRTEDALDDALHGQNGLREDMRAVRTLRRTHQRYGNDPQRIELDYTSVAITLRREMRETYELAETEDNLALLEAVEEGALAIRAQHPEIAANRQRIAQQKLREMDSADLEVLEAAGPVLEALSEGVMAEDFARDIPQLINDATTPLPSGAPPLPGVDESMRVFHRVSRMKVILDKMTDKGAGIFDSKTNKTVRLGMQGMKVAAYLGVIVDIGLKLFGVL